MIQRIQSMKNKKGFTLVELIVVLVILVILAAIAVPSFMQYIDKARRQSVEIEAHSVSVAVNSIASEFYGRYRTASVVPDDFQDQVEELALVSGTIDSIDYDFNEGYIGAVGDEFTYTSEDGVYEVTFTVGENKTLTWTVD